MTKSITHPVLGAKTTLHVARGIGAALIASAGAREVARIDDWLAWGQSRVDPVEHARARERISKGLGLNERKADDERLAERIDFLSRGAVPLDLVVWTANTWSDRLTLLWLCDFFRRHGTPPRHTVWVVEVPSTASGQAYERRVHPEGLALWPVECLRAEWEMARRLRDHETEYGRRLWLKFADPSPLEFDMERRMGFPGMPAMKRVAWAHHLMFPRLVRRRLLLSLLDEAVLRGVGDMAGSRSWRRVADVLGYVVRNHLSVIRGIGSDRPVWERLFAWAKEGAAVKASGGSIVTPFKRRYTLTGYGRDLIAGGGFQRMPNAPTIHCGGCELYGDSPWACGGK